MSVCVCVCVCCYLSFCASEQVYLSAHSGCVLCSVSPDSGRGPGSRAAIVCQSGSAADGLSSPPSCGVLFFSCLILSFRILFISSSVPPEIPQSSSSFILRETFLTLNLLYVRDLLHSSLGIMIYYCKINHI